MGQAHPKPLPDILHFCRLPSPASKLLTIAAKAMSPLVNPAALFRFRFPCQQRKKLWPPPLSGIDERCRLPSLAAVSNVPDLLTLWLAWNDEGLGVRAMFTGSGASPWCQPTRPEDSDGLHLWIATHPTGESHRAGRYCRRLALLPTTLVMANTGHPTSFNLFIALSVSAVSPDWVIAIAPVLASVRLK